MSLFQHLELPLGYTTFRSLLQGIQFPLKDLVLLCLAKYSVTLLVLSVETELNVVEYDCQLSNYGRTRVESRVEQSVSVFFRCYEQHSLMHMLNLPVTHQNVFDQLIMISAEGLASLQVAQETSFEAACDHYRVRDVH